MGVKVATHTHHIVLESAPSRDMVPPASYRATANIWQYMGSSGGKLVNLLESKSKTKQQNEWYYLLKYS